jgi:putative (di)nucleoside polyphosphate hydrolase|tara:strand:+ start:1270 stop:1740 length:471 start_codon:yes stop_codon:yes gene_type:complete
MNKDQLPLRIGVGAIVLNKENKVFVGRRIDNPINNWQMPQGGANKNEPLLEAMRRELCEETNIKNIKILKKLDQWFQYELPDELLGKIWKGRFRGQKQKWFIVKFLGEDSEININTKNPEFIEWRWIDFKKLPEVIVYFKKDLYKNLVSNISSFIV